MVDAPPARPTAGDNWSWTAPAAFAAYPPPDYALTYTFRPETGGPILRAVATWAGGTYSLQVAATETANLAPGRYVWAAVAENDATGDRATHARGTIEVLADPMRDTADRRSPAARILAAIEATLAGRVTADAASYSIEGRSLTRTPVEDLLRLRETYRRQVAAEKGGGRLFRVRRVCR